MPNLVYNFIFYFVSIMYFYCLFFSFDLLAQKVFSRSAHELVRLVFMFTATSLLGLFLFIVSAVSEYGYFLAISAVLFSVFYVSGCCGPAWIRFVKKWWPYAIVTFVYVFGAFTILGDDLIGRKVAIHYWPSVDNHISLIVGDLFKYFGSSYFHVPMFGPIPITDRNLVAYGLTHISVLSEQSQSSFFIFSVCLQSIWVFPIYYIFKLINRREAGFYLFLFASNGVIFMYSIYTWYKIVAAAVFLPGILLSYRAARCVGRRNLKVWLSSTMFLSILWHPSHLFSGAGLFLANPKVITRRGVVLFSLLSILVGIIYQLEPPSGQMLRWHFLGSPDAIGQSLISLFRQNFADVGKLVEFKINNFYISFWPFKVATDVLVDRIGHVNLPGFIRYLQAYSLFLSAFPIAFLIPFYFVNGGRLRGSFLKFLTKFLFLSFIITNVLEYGGPYSEAILHHRAFVETMVLQVLLISMLVNLSLREKYFWAGFNFLWFIVIWIPKADMFGTSLSPNLSYLTSAFAIGLVCFWLWRNQRSRI